MTFKTFDQSDERAWPDQNSPCRNFEEKVSPYLCKFWEYWFFLTILTIVNRVNSLTILNRVRQTCDRWNSTFLTTGSLNSLQSLLPDNHEWHWQHLQLRVLPQQSAALLSHVCLSVHPSQARRLTFSPLSHVLDHANHIFSESLWRPLFTDQLVTTWSALKNFSHIFALLSFSFC